MILKNQLKHDGYGADDIVRLSIYSVSYVGQPFYRVKDIPDKYMNHICTLNELTGSYILNMAN